MVNSSSSSPSWLILSALLWLTSCQLVAEAYNPLEVAFLDIVQPFIDRAVSTVFDQKLANQNGTRIKNRKYLLEDESNESLGHATPQEIIRRSGFEYKNHWVMSDDGYITQLIRIINPKADRAHLKGPPVVMLHGGIIDATAWIWASAIQHHPEKWPRSAEDGHMTSWNRSLAFTLANNGYDVWLMSVRGSNSQNMGHKKYNTKQKRLVDNPISIEADRIKYWQFTMDDVVRYELTSQLDKILEVTGAKKVSMVAISVGVTSTLHLLASNKKYAHKFHTYVALGPTLSNKGSNRLLSFAMKGPCVMGPEQLGTIVWTELITSQLVRDVFNLFGKAKPIRYSLAWAVVLLLTGPSPVYQTNLEAAVIAHILQPTGYKMIRQWCQNLNTAKLQEYDYGPAQNLLHYGKVHPKSYSYKHLVLPKHWMLVSGSNDVLATPHAVQILKQGAPIKPYHIDVPSYNHVDLVAAMDNDVRVNLPILKFLDKHCATASKHRHGA